MLLAPPRHTLLYLSPVAFCFTYISSSSYNTYLPDTILKKIQKNLQILVFVLNLSQYLNPISSYFHPSHNNLI